MFQISENKGGQIRSFLGKTCWKREEFELLGEIRYEVFGSKIQWTKLISKCLQISPPLQGYKMKLLTSLEAIHEEKGNVRVIGVGTT